MDTTHVDNQNSSSEMKIQVSADLEQEDLDTMVSMESGECDMDVDLKLEDTNSPIATHQKSGVEKSKDEFPGLKPKASAMEDEINALYKSLGIAIDDPKEAGKMKELRLDALHVRGVSEMSTDDILDYFREYKPLSVEWINDFSCNVLWKDAVCAARALLGISRPVVVHKKGHEVATSESSKTKEEDPACPKKEEAVQDAAAQEREEVIMLTDDSDDEDDGIDFHIQDDKKPAQDNASSVSKMTMDDVDVPVPPGRWRLGASCPKAKALLIRFARKVDKKVPGAEKRSQYYLKHGNPNYGGLKGLISRSCKKRFRQSGSARAAPMLSTKRMGGLSSDDSQHSDDDSIGDVKRRKSKKIRMRMYADDEERKQKRRRTGASNPFLTTDLQSRLGRVPHLKVSVASSPPRDSDNDTDEERPSKDDDHRSDEEPLSLPSSRPSSVWSRLNHPQSSREQNIAIRRGSSEEEDDDEEEEEGGSGDNWGGHVSDLRSRIGNTSKSREVMVMRSGMGDLRVKLDRLRRDREVQKHRSPLLIQVTNDAGGE